MLTYAKAFSLISNAPMTGNDQRVFAVSKVSTDSRNIAPQSVYFALKGEQHDGHDFVKEALEKGASYAVISQSKSAVFSDQIRHRLILTDEPLLGLHRLAQGYRLALGTKVVGLTGSVGKTTAKELIAAILKQVAPTYATVANFNNEVGVAKTLLAFEPIHEFGVVEMGARHFGDIDFLAQTAQPDLALCLNIGMAHIGEFGSFDKLRETKLGIFRSAKEGATWLGFADDPSIAMFFKQSKHDPCYTFTAKNQKDALVSLLSVEPTAFGMRVEMRVKDSVIAPHFAMYHYGLAINACAAALVATIWNVPLPKIEAGFAAYRPAKGRFESLKKGHQTFIDDAYNASPSSMKTAIESVAKGFPQSRIGLMLGDMLELGSFEETAHQEIGELCSQIPRLEKLVTVGPRAKIINQTAHHGGVSEKKLEHFDLCPNHYDPSLFANCDVILVKASRAIGLDKWLSCVTDDK